MALAWLFRIDVTVSGNDNTASLRVGKALGTATECIAIAVALCCALCFTVQQHMIVKGSIIAGQWTNWLMFVLMIMVRVSMDSFADVIGD